jgi:microcin C transport system permease protein
VGSYLIEKVFNIDGFGLLGFNSLIHRDYPVVLASMVIGSVIRLLGNILSDMIYAAIDPRIRFK